MSKEAMQMALEALESKYIVNCGAWRVQQDQAITALRQALEEKQEPVAWISEGGDVSRSKRYMDEMGFKCNPLYTAPPKREWVGLTDDEIMEPWPFENRIAFARWLESKIKEKNT